MSRPGSVTETATRGASLYDWWSRHPRALDALYAVAFLGRESGIRRHAFERLDAAPGDRVLEVGSGRGDALEELGERVGDTGRAVGLDASRGMVEAAHSRNRDQSMDNVHVLRGDARRPPFTAATFDAAYAAMSLSAVPDPERAIEATAAVLRPGGRFVVLDARPFREWPWRLCNPVVVPAAKYATNWVPAVDVVAVLQRVFDDVDVATFNGGSMFVAHASLEDS
jgi:ubiquinone/menaquinone biosynthesis C-methylase UbiE